MRLIYTKLIFAALLIYSVILTLNSVRDYLIQLESGELIAIGFFAVLSLASLAVLLTMNPKQKMQTDNFGTNFVSNIAIDFLGGFIRGYQKS